MTLRAGILRETKDPPHKRVPLAPSQIVDFGRQLVSNVLPRLFFRPDSEMIRRATILEKGKLTKQFRYLSDYLF